MRKWNLGKLRFKLQTKLGGHISDVRVLNLKRLLTYVGTVLAYGKIILNLPPFF